SQEGQSLASGPAQDGRPAPSAARLREAQGSRALSEDHREARHSPLSHGWAAFLPPAVRSAGSAEAFAVRGPQLVASSIGSATVVRSGRPARHPLLRWLQAPNVVPGYERPSIQANRNSKD